MLRGCNESFVVGVTQPNQAGSQQLVRGGLLKAAAWRHVEIAHAKSRAVLKGQL